LDPLTEVIRQKVIEGVAEALKSKEISPQDILYEKGLSNQEKLVLALGAMPDYLLLNFIESTISLIDTIYRHSEPRPFGFKVQKDVMATLEVMGKYAREEITDRQLESYLYENGIIKSRPVDIDPPAIAKIVVTLYRTITELNAHHDVDFYSETDNRDAYLEEVNDRMAEMLYFIVEATYKNSLH